MRCHQSPCPLSSPYLATSMQDTIIPADAFPHILAAILAAAADPVLRAFRATSGARREAADDRLFATTTLVAHLAEPDPPPSPIAMEAAPQMS